MQITIDTNRDNPKDIASTLTLALEIIAAQARVKAVPTGTPQAPVPDFKPSDSLPPDALEQGKAPDDTRAAAVFAHQGPAPFPPVATAAAVIPLPPVPVPLPPAAIPPAPLAAESGPVVGGVAPLAPTDAAVPLTFRAVMAKVTASKNAGKLTQADVDAALVMVGLKADELAPLVLPANAALLAAFNDLIDMKVST